MELLRTILQWATPGILLLFLFRGAYKETKKVGYFNPINGPASTIAVSILLLGVAVGLRWYLFWLY
jgi:hypothetical protein